MAIAFRYSSKVCNHNVSKAVLNLHVIGPDLDDLAVAALDQKRSGEGADGGGKARQHDAVEASTGKQAECLRDEEDDDITDCEEEPATQGAFWFLQRTLPAFQTLLK